MTERLMAGAGGRPTSLAARAFVALSLTFITLVWSDPVRAVALPPHAADAAIEAAKAEAEAAAAAAEAVEKARRITSQAIQLASEGKHDQARERASTLDDPALMTLMEWYRVRDANLGAGFAAISAFMTAHPTWPLMDTIAIRAEGALYVEKPEPDVIIAHFARHPPRSGVGKLALARALTATGETERAAELISDAWRSHEFGKSLERRILKEFGDRIDDADHRARLIRQIYNRERAAAIRTAKHLTPGHVKMARAASYLFRRHRSALRRYRQVPSQLRGQLAMQYALAYYHRRRGNSAKARAILVNVPSGADELSHPAAWWIERRDAARTALRRNTPELWETAYKLTSGHSVYDGTYFVQGEFMSGWIALQFLKKPELAIPHFELILERNERALNRSQAHYWVGRAYQALEDDAKADEHFKAAAAFPTAFYGQLARDAVGWGTAPIVLFAPTVTPEREAAFADHEQARVIRMLHDADHHGHMRNFFFNLAHVLEPVEDRVALASLARDLGHHHIALRIAKISARRGAELPQFSYPTDILPEFDKPGRQVEQALIHALIRQESEFNPAAISHAGARGLMQLMPATAKGVARLHGARYHRPHLTQRPQYNLMLGTAHVGDLIHAFGGSYIMTIAAYNAGPGRIPQWTKRYGDPRQGEIEAVDFIESIPFNETRNYVKRVLENLQVYRSLFGVTPPIPISIDMHRGGEMPEEIAEMNSCEAEADPSIEQMIACN